jgi:hypothetical protein
MKILVAGARTSAADLIEALGRPGDNEIIHCTDEICALDKLLSEKYEWAIISGLTLSEGIRENARLIRAMASVIKRKAGPPAPDDPCPRDSAACGVEWSKDGVLQLHCSLHALLKDPIASPCAGKIGSGDIFFEYHAPCAKDRRRHG